MSTRVCSTLGVAGLYGAGQGVMFQMRRACPAAGKSGSV
jgi:hypothetical protein